MPVNTRVITAMLIGRSGAVVMSRVLGWAGTPVTMATLSSIYVQVWDLDYGVAVYGPTQLTISQVWYDSLQTSLPWFEAGGDSQGYNFQYTVPAQALSMAGRRARVDAKITPVSGEAFVVQAEGNLSPSYIP